MRTHQEIDRRSLALHQLIADKVRRDHQLLERVRATLARWRTVVAPSSQPYLQEWSRLLDQGMDTCLSVATEESERATALRQCSPFVGILSEEERTSFLKDWRPFPTPPQPCGLDSERAMNGSDANTEA